MEIEKKKSKPNFETMEETHNYHLSQVTSKRAEKRAKSVPLRKRFGLDKDRTCGYNNKDWKIEDCISKEFLEYDSL